MFANMNYPRRTAAFVESVTQEARQQLARLNAAIPCRAVAIVRANSSGDGGALRDNWAPKAVSFCARRARTRIVSRRPYWPSSAHGGSFPHQGNHGTTSYYGVGAYMRPLEDARRGEIRFRRVPCVCQRPEERTLARLPGGLSIRNPSTGVETRAPRDLGAGWDFDDCAITI